MFHSKLSVAANRVSSAAALIALALLASGCAGPVKDPTLGWSTDKLYSEARDELQSGAYEKSIPLFEKLEGRAAGTPLAQQAQLEKAYAQYRNADLVQATATLDRFMKLHPASPALDYALYLKGLINFNDNLGIFGALARKDLSESDQKAAKEAFQDFKDLVTRFPQSRYAPDARQRMSYIVNSLAKSEVNVARYYYSRGAYVAAVNRAQAAITEFRDVPAIEEAVYLLYRSYDALGMTALRDDAKRVMQTSYPNSPYLSQGLNPAKAPWYKFW